MSEIVTRLLIAAGLIAAGLGAYWGWSRWQMRRLGCGRQGQLPGLETLQPCVPAILYFTTPDCLVCKTAQQPALRRLQARLGEAVQVIQIDAAERPAIADYWGVLSVPTTFIIDGQGRPRAVNHGLASQAKLEQQLAEVQPSPEPAPGRRGAARVTAEAEPSSRRVLP